MAKYKIYISVVEVYEGEAENAAEAQKLAASGQFGDAIEQYDTDDITVEQI